ncbi:C13 family peptidase [Dongia soli]|uniref:C13 family peptidase n=1 Tax=Dongia soli TaxID=600628 RepID=A0ABU5E4M3_9PROT|nr:C13 family peptidase [Dongia soli]MDY0881260.1 C13 family peptidase [Dongia soli]
MSQMNTSGRLLAALLLLLAAGCSSNSGSGRMQSTAAQTASLSQASAGQSAQTGLHNGPKHWVALLVAGDDSAPVFDNAVNRIKAMLAQTNVVATQAMSSDFTKTPADQIATVARMDDALSRLPIDDDTGCFVFVTSHGGRRGLLMANDLDSQRFLTPGDFGRMLDARCGNHPTVAIVSACFSGIFLDQMTMAPNRIILTAARRDRPSFGCSAEETYTYYDSCLIDNWQRAQSFGQLHRDISRCVHDKEVKLGVKPSEPQAYFGSAIGDVPLPR